jgi:hypothetical protein
MLDYIIENYENLRKHMIHYLLYKQFESTSTE